ncbi:VOC family protein [Marivirga sp. S37H4]|uniref:VOC family protein n=1 Tax=Marivirga aurantiaca TaxID=2802615 RepID=A0A934WXW7_9BACT|nr:VOC family protein [Marivirga aurantiaca]MBK6264841.1 VOC family protein [Marivirga aurantiaca]
MKNYLGRIVLLVEDYEKASKFYEENFGFKKIFDVTTDVGQRFLHLGGDTSDNFGIWFIKADSKEQKGQIGRQTNGQPTMVIYTTSLNELFEKLKKNKVEIKVAPVNTPEFKFFHCLDLYGNEIVVVEIAE